MTFKERHIIDLFKGTTFIFILSLIYYYEKQENLTIWMYLAIHGSYGFFWVLKSNIFPDKSWEKEVTVFRFFLLTIGLLCYWMSPFLIVYNDVSHSPAFLCLCVSTYCTGVFLHFSSDMQKSVSLQLKPGHLITTGLWKNTRNPNYLGEFFIYASFSLMSWNLISAAIFGSVIICEWIPNMLRKDKSLSKYKEFIEYKSQSGIFFPNNFSYIHKIKKDEE